MDLVLSILVRRMVSLSTNTAFKSVVVKVYRFDMAHHKIVEKAKAGPDFKRPQISMTGRNVLSGKRKIQLLSSPN